ncbi:MAG: amino acid transporter [Nitrospira sp. WS110]|nr:amino acid transporter [Nitrospira sp. WS110]
MYPEPFLTVGFISLIAAMSPGPDFVIVATHGLNHSRTIGFCTAVGVAVGLGVHVFYSLVGIGLFATQSPSIICIITYLGAGYLCYLGYKLLSTHGRTFEITPTCSKTHLDYSTAVRRGFFTNVLNPKAALFFAGIFTQVITPSTPIYVQILYGFEIVCIVLVWFTFVAMFVSHAKVRKRLLLWETCLNRMAGCVLILLGAKIAIASTS